MERLHVSQGEYTSCGSFNTNIVLVSHDKYFVVGMSQHVNVYAIKTGQKVLSLDAESEVTSIASDNNHRLWVSTQDGTIQLFDVERGERLVKAKISTCCVRNLTVTDRVYYITNGYVRSRDSSIEFENEKEDILIHKNVTNFCVSKDGSLVMGILGRNLFIHHKKTKKIET